jgi:DNA-binding LacI/PurR family transcriptional regulator
MPTLKDVAERANVPIAQTFQALTNPSEVDASTVEAVLQAAQAIGYHLNITIRDVAAYAGVSVTTVSYVVNNNPLIKPATRQKVRNAIRELGYHPNTTARNLKTSETRMIGYAWHVVEDSIRRNPLLDFFLYELAEYAESCGYHILTFTQPPHSGMKPYEDLINTNRVDGFVLSDVVYDDPRVRRLIEMKVPFSTYGKANDEWDFPYVDVDGRRGIEIAVEHLVSKGHERIGLISWPHGSRIGDVRTQGYLHAMQSAGLSTRDSWVAYSPNTLDQAFESAKQILSGKPRPTAIACANDIMAFGAKRYLESVGLEAGTDVALVGYDDTPVAELIGLTSIRQPIPLIADKVVELLLTDIEGNRPPEHRIVLEPSLVVRSSSVNPRRI